jgi:putative ATP-dependent endonuclease of OLD family
MTLFDLAEGTANVIAIDEPELHLHPASQRTVAELFSDATNQKILATHSPFIVQRFEPSQIIAVDPRGASHQIAADKLTAVEKVRANWWSPRLLEALTARHAIIVEGPSDRVIVEAVARLMNISLDRLGAVVFDIDGADKFPNVYRLIGKTGFCVPVLGLVDDAEKMRWHGQIGGKPADVFGRSIFVSTPDLEAEYCGALTGPGAGRALIASGYSQESAILATSQAATIEDVTDEAMAAYCRKNKVDAAVAIASQLDSATATRITSVRKLLLQLQATDSE